ncbi:biopolymer transporter ExbD [Chitinimonas sp.]|uniref:ExbD/TolR family protein n=1 Tax=Chitinimonas sp. TaxID=1934313 RepID=UPI002F9230E8
MNVGNESGGDDEVVSAINTTPLVDVMLVLLIIFLITIPVATHTVPVKLPNETIKANETKPENINISVNKDGDVFWNQVLIPDNNTLVSKLKEESVKTPQPEVQIRGDQGARYEFVGRVIVACQRAGIVKVGFITEPPPRG